MNERPPPEEFALESFLQQQERKSLLRFVVCGSVDHGKSTLIGRLLYDSKQLFDDQLEALEADSRKFGTQGDELDFSLLLDGLAAEREQKITIDVAYRFFATARRKFIVIDAPGHEQYTANMATGASMADVALVLVGADAGLTRQTKRHVVIVSTLGVRRVVLAVNKMDLVGWSEEAFRAIEAEFSAFAKDLGISEIKCIPVAANTGDNVIGRSGQMRWYRGPALLEHLEAVPLEQATNRQPFRMPIQWINRPNPDFRGYSGLITSGEVSVGMPVQILPAGRVSQVARIVTFDGDLDHALSGRSVTLTFDDPVDASRGDLIVGIEQPPATTERISARIFWMDRHALAPGRNYLFKLASTTAKATVERGLNVIDLDTQHPVAAELIAQNETGSCSLKLDRPIAVDRYAENKHTGSFILIDPESYDTVGMGCVEVAAADPPPRRWWFSKRNPKRASGAAMELARSTETRARSLAKAVSWRATGSIDTFVVTFVITGSTKFAGSVAVTEIATKILIYYFHERVWAWVPWGKRRAA